MGSFRAIYDTCVLVPAPLRDLLLRVAEAGLVRASMSDDILDELERVLVRDFAVPDAAATRLCSAVERTFEDSVTERDRYADLVGLAGLPDTDDEHVLALARSVGAQAIVTTNLKDFPDDKVGRFDLEILHPDDFLLDLVDLFPVKVARIVEEQAAIARQWSWRSTGCGARPKGGSRTYKMRAPLAVPEALGFRSNSVPSGIRTRVAGVKGRYPGPLDDGDKGRERPTQRLGSSRWTARPCGAIWSAAS